MLKQLIPALVLLGLSGQVMAQGDIKAGEQKAATCVACHGPTGKSSSALYPSLAGQSQPYLVEVLEEYKKGQRTGGHAGIMKAYMAGMSDQDIADLAAWYASQKAG